GGGTTLGGGGGLGGGVPPSSKDGDSKPRLGTSESAPQGPRVRNEIGAAPVLHAIDVVHHLSKGLPVVLGASNLGVTMHGLVAIPGSFYGTQTLVSGAPGDAPKKGASEVHLGRLKDGRRFLATVEPWHGTDVAVYLSESMEPLPLSKFGPRTVIDSTLKEGHALWVADVDGDGDDEVFAGYRGKGTSLLGYDFDGKTWNRTVIDTAIAAQDLRGGDIDGDGTPDIVAIAGSAPVGMTSNSWYFQIGAYSVGGFNTNNQYPLPGASAIAAGDFDGDGRVDAAVADATATTGMNAVHILSNDGTTLTWSATFPITGGGGSIAVADLDGDGKLDIVVGMGVGIGVLMNRTPSP
ncbi:MAG: repeat protein, partial [bacterium]|nr:repeat protein [bacterium]